ncbi:N-acetyltransferase [Streptacidiphilus sp. EB129]|uniref:N-acetyltransferase n=1 Tax=Streptacidiphilus sp. EB129 TaxID=3156262 RepID=UPI003514AA0D
MTWLPADFVHPERVDLPGGYYLRPIRGTDTELDYPAVMGSRERLWSLYGEAWGWPPATMTYQQDLDDLIRHEAEIEAHESFNYALFDEAGTALLGCVYIDPSRKAGADAEVSWWVVDAQVGTQLERDLDALVPAWLAQEWPFRQPCLVGREVSWQDWLARPDLD